MAITPTVGLYIMAEDLAHSAVVRVDGVYIILFRNGTKAYIAYN